MIATQKKKAEAAATVGPLYQHDSNIEQQSISEIEGFFKRLDEMQGTLRAGESLSDAINFHCLHIRTCSNTNYSNKKTNTQ